MELDAGQEAYCGLISQMHVDAVFSVLGMVTGISDVQTDYKALKYLRSCLDIIIII